jgi:hypothetical protein
MHWGRGSTWVITSQLLTGTHTTQKGKEEKEIHTRIMSEGCVLLLRSFGKLEAKHALVLGLGTFVAPVL